MAYAFIRLDDEIMHAIESLAEHQGQPLEAILRSAFETYFRQRDISASEWLANADRLLGLIFRFKDDDQSVTLSEVLQDRSTQWRVVDVARIQQFLDRVLASLTCREQHVLIFRFGLMGDKPLSRNAVGAAIGTSAVRVRQIEGKALRKLRHPSRSRHLQQLRFKRDEMWLLFLLPPELHTIGQDDPCAQHSRAEHYLGLGDACRHHLELEHSAWRTPEQAPSNTLQ